MLLYTLEEVRYMQYINDNIIFGLDIGTRSIVGLVGYKNSNGFNVIASHMEFHRTRSMFDGQIHDIENVAETIRRVKDALEIKNRQTAEKGVHRCSRKGS